MLQSGINAGDFTVHIIKDGDILELTVDLSRPLVDISFLHKKWLIRKDSSFTDLHTELLCFRLNEEI